MKFWIIFAALFVFITLIAFFSLDLWHFVEYCGFMAVFIVVIGGVSWVVK